MRAEPIVDPLLGLALGNYRISKKLGEGGMGLVYLAVHPAIGREVAVKVLCSNPATHSKAADRFLTEAKSLTKLRHPNIVDIYDFGQLDDGRLYYVMDLLEGEELKTLMAKRGAMKANEVLPLAQQICAALYCAHSRDIVHRDLKPSNIFVAGDDPPIVKVLDFGVAKLLGPQDDDTASTKSGVVVGTPLFLAPEQATGDHDRICPQTDIYALGVLMYWMLSGWPPFRQKTFAKLIADHISTEPKPLQEMRSDIPWAVASVVHRCLAKDPADRPRTALEVSEDFAAAIADGCEKTLDPLDPSKGPLDPESEDGAALRLRQQALTALSNGQRQPSTTATAPTVASTATARSREQTSRRLWLLLSIALVLGGGATAMLLMRNNNQDKIPSTAVSDAGVPGISKGVVVSVDAARRPVDLRAVTKAVDLVADAGPELTKRRPTRRKASTRRKSPPERSKSPTRRGKLGEGTVKVEF